MFASMSGLTGICCRGYGHKENEQSYIIIIPSLPWKTTITTLGIVNEENNSPHNQPDADSSMSFPIH